MGYSSRSFQFPPVGVDNFQDIPGSTDNGKVYEDNRKTPNLQAPVMLPGTDPIEIKRAELSGSSTM